MSLAPAALLFVLLIILFVLFVWLIPVRLWIAAWSSGARVGFGELIGMRLRRVSPWRPACRWWRRCSISAGDSTGGT